MTNPGTSALDAAALGTQDNPPVTVMLVDDHAVVRSGLRAMLDAASGIEVVAEAGDVGEAERLLEQKTPDVLLLDIQLSGNENGLTVLRRLPEISPGTKAIVLSAFLSPVLLKTCMDAGAMGYLVKDTKKLDLPGAIRTVAAGGQVLDASVCDMRRRVETGTPTSLTPRELDVLTLLCKGHSNADIATRLCLSENAVKGFVSSIMHKFGCTNRVQVVLKAKEERVC